MGAVRPGLVEQAPAAEDPAIDFPQPQLAAELDWLAGLVADDDLAVRLEQAHDLLARRHRLAAKDAPHGLHDHALQALQDWLELPPEPPGRRIAPGLQHSAHSCGLSSGLLRDRDQPRIGRAHGAARLLTLAPAQAVQALDQTSCAAGSRAEHGLAQIRGLLKRHLGPAQEPAEHAHAVSQEAAVARVMDRGLHHRAVDAQLAPARHFEPSRQRHHTLVEGEEGLWRDEVGPAQQRGVVRHLLQIDAAELAQDQTVGNEVLDLLVAPAVEALDHEKAQDDLDGRARPSPAQGVWRPLRQVGPDALKDRVTLEQAIEFAQHRFKLAEPRRDEGEQVHGRISVDQHDGGPPACEDAGTASTVHLNHVYFEKRSFSSSGSRWSLTQRRSATAERSRFSRPPKAPPPRGKS